MSHGLQSLSHPQVDIPPIELLNSYAVCAYRNVQFFILIVVVVESVPVQDPFPFSIDGSYPIFTVVMLIYHYVERIVEFL